MRRSSTLPRIVFLLAFFLAPVLLVTQTEATSSAGPESLDSELLAGPANKSSSGWDLQEALKYCEQLDDLYAGIYNDLSPWAEHGIERSTMAAAISKFTTRGSNKGIALAFLNGTAHVVEATLSGPVGHHAGIYFTYMQVMLELQQLFGPLIPDVEFVVASSDRPMVPLNSSSSSSSSRPYLPVFRFCSSEVHADIQVPIFHFYTKRYTQTMLQTIPAVNEMYPWEQKKEILFGRFSNYMRYIIPDEPLLSRLGTDGRNICKVESADTAACRVRQHLIIWALRHPELLDIKSSPRVAMQKHAQYKYLLHLDGQALSSRIDLLMPLNSLIFKEESGYTTFYHHLLKPQVHYVPVWKKTPDDILTAIQWAKEHDEEARTIAANAQQFALRYLNKRARTCYWFRLLVEFSRLLKYKVSPEHEVREAEEARRAKAKGQRRSRALQSKLQRDEGVVGGRDGDVLVEAGERARWSANATQPTKSETWRRDSGDGLVSSGVQFTDDGMDMAGEKGGGFTNRLKQRLMASSPIDSVDGDHAGSVDDKHKLRNSEQLATWDSAQAGVGLRRGAGTAGRNLAHDGTGPGSTQRHLLHSSDKRDGDRGHWMTVAEYLETVATEFEGGRWYNRKAEGY